MQSKKIDIKLTMHARSKILERNIIIGQLKDVILNYEKSEIVISAFYDRRLKRRKNK